MSFIIINKVCILINRILKTFKLLAKQLVFEKVFYYEKGITFPIVNFDAYL